MNEVRMFSLVLEHHCSDEIHTNLMLLVLYWLEPHLLGVVFHFFLNAFLGWEDFDAKSMYIEG
jgi:hypothetical protein